MDEQKRTIPVISGQTAEKFEAFAILGIVGTFQLFTSPENRPFSSLIEAFRVAKGTHVMIAQKTDLAIRHDQVEALSWVRTISDNVAEAMNHLDALGTDIRENDLQSFQVPVNVADDGATQGQGSSMNDRPGSSVRRLSLFFVRLSPKINRNSCKRYEVHKNQRDRDDPDGPASMERQAISDRLSERNRFFDPLHD